MSDEVWFCGDLLSLQQGDRRRTVLACVDKPGHAQDVAHRSGTDPVLRWRTNRHDSTVRDVWVEQSDDFFSMSVGAWDLPEARVTRGGTGFPASAHVSPGVGSPDDDGPPVAPQLSSTGWCAPSDFISNGGPISPEDAARIEHELRPCGGEHRWERWVSSSQCGCSQCDYTEQYVECAGCPAVVREGEPGFEELWETAPWA